MKIMTTEGFIELDSRIRKYMVVVAGHLFAIHRHENEFTNFDYKGIWKLTHYKSGRLAYIRYSGTKKQLVTDFVNLMEKRFGRLSEMSKEIDKLNHEEVNNI